MRVQSVFLAMLAAAAGCAAAERFHWQEVSADSLALEENGSRVLVYNHGMLLGKGAPEDRRRSGYVHPLYAPDGTVVTDDFAKDHYHHRGVFWAWPVVEVEGRKYDLWMMKGIRQRFVKWTRRAADSKKAVLEVENGWFVGDRKVVREFVEIEARPSTAVRREIEFRLRFEAVDAAVTLSGAPEENKGYGNFSVRFAPRTATTLASEKGPDVPDSDRVASRWAELSGVYGGRRAVLRIEQDEKNPAYPNGWCLRHYGFLGVDFPALERFTIEPGKPLEERFRLTLSSEAPGSEVRNKEQ